MYINERLDFIGHWYFVLVIVDLMIEIQLLQNSIIQFDVTRNNIASIKMWNMLYNAGNTKKSYVLDQIIDLLTDDFNIFMSFLIFIHFFNNI